MPDPYREFYTALKKKDVLYIKSDAMEKLRQGHSLLKYEGLPWHFGILACNRKKISAKYITGRNKCALLMMNTN